MKKRHRDWLLTERKSRKEEEEEKGGAPSLLFIQVKYTSQRASMLFRQGVATLPRETRGEFRTGQCGRGLSQPLLVVNGKQIAPFLGNIYKGH